jgi:hypothetical protein
MDGTTWAALALTLGSALATLLLTALARLATISLEYLHGRLTHDLSMRRAKESQSFSAVSVSADRPPVRPPVRPADSVGTGVPVSTTRGSTLPPDDLT